MTLLRQRGAAKGTGLLLVLGLAAVLAGLLWWALTPAPRIAADTTPEELVETLEAAKLFLAEEGACATSASDLVLAGYADGALDRWGNPYRIMCNGETVRVASDGPDGTEGTGDDLNGQ